MESNVDLQRLVSWFEDSEETTAGARALAERDRDYYDGLQLTKTERDTLKARGQPDVIVNRIKRKVDSLTGIEKQQRSDPKGFPRNPGDEDSSMAATKAIRYVIENNAYDHIRSRVWRNWIIEGVGGCLWTVDPSQRETTIKCKYIAWDRIFYDPHSSEPDFSDAKYKGYVIWMDLDDAKRAFPNHADDLAAAVDRPSGVDDTFDDKPKTKVWYSSRRKRVRVVQIYWSEGKHNWFFATYTKDVLFEKGPCPHIDADEDGNFCPFNISSAFVMRDNERYGAVREMISPQDEINKRRSKSLHLMTMRQARVTPGSEAAQNTENLRKELARPDGVVEAFKDEFEILNNNDQVAGHLGLLQEAKAEIDEMGPNPSLQGKEPRDLSGRALLARAQAGLMELGDLLDRKRQWDLVNYRMAWSLIKQYWTAEKWIRITDDDGSPEFVGLNRPVTVGEVMQKEFGAPAPEFLANRPAVDERGQPMIENKVAEIDIDIILDEGPDSITLRSEQFEALSGSGLLNSLPPDIVIEMIPSMDPDVRSRILDRLKNKPDEAQQQALALEFRGREAEIAETEASAMDKRASAISRLSQG